MILINKLKGWINDGMIERGARRILRINTLMLEGTAKSVAKAERLKRTMRDHPQTRRMIYTSIAIRNENKRV